MLKQRVKKSNNSISDDGIVIKVYTESTTRLHHQKNKNAKSTKKIDINSRRGRGRGRGGGGGYDRRAQLLARVHELRGLQTLDLHNAEFQEMDNNNPKLNQKKGKFTMFSMSMIGLWCSQCFNGPEKQECGYERIVTEEYPSKIIEELGFEEAAKTSSPNKRKSKFFKKVKDFLKDLSCIWHCKKF